MQRMLLALLNVKEAMNVQVLQSYALRYDLTPRQGEQWGGVAVSTSRSALSWKLQKATLPEQHPAAGLPRLHEHMRVCSDLEVLCPQITDVGAQGLADALQADATLIALDLRRNKISNRG